MNKTKTNIRWVILGLLFVATTILYIDRSALGILAPDLQKSIGWSEEQYGIINMVFMEHFHFIHRAKNLPDMSIIYKTI